jgi:hypothetical protein
MNPLFSLVLRVVSNECLNHMVMRERGVPFRAPSNTKSGVPALTLNAKASWHVVIAQRVFALQRALCVHRRRRHPTHALLASHGINPNARR